LPFPRSPWLFPLTLCLLVIAPAAAQTGFAPSVSVQRERVQLTVNADGTYRESAEQSVRIRTAKGVEDYGSQEISYIASQEEILSVDAWTVTPQGTRIPVMPEAIRDRADDNSGGVAELSDTRVRVIVFPRVSVGSVITYQATSRVHTTPYPGEFTRTFLFSSSLPYEDWELRVVMPASRTLHIEQRGVQGGLEKTVDGWSHYTFRYRRESAEPSMRGAAGPLHRGDYLLLSTMADPLALGRAARHFFEPQVEVTDEIRRLALSLTANATSDRDRVRALYHWVTQNIRYVSVALGAGRLVPRSASTVLDTRYGDCKDHVVLLESLLLAVGIPSSPALISSGSDHRLPSIGAHYPIDHVITYVPSLDLYLDATDPFAPFGTLPWSDLDKPVILTRLDRQGRTPPMRAQEHTSRTQVRMTITPQGSIRGSAYTRKTGYLENRSRRSRFEDSSRAMDDVVRSQLFRFNEAGTGTLRYADPSDITQPYEIRSEFTLEPLVNIPGRGAMTVPVGLAPGDIAYLGFLQPEPISERPTMCASRSIEERYVLTFPPNLTIDSVPPGTRYRQGGIVFESRYTQAGRTVTVDRRLSVQRPSRICGLQESRDWHAFYRVIQRELRSQIVYR
jgi:hypothetical protein